MFKAILQKYRETFTSNNLEVTTNESTLKNIEENKTIIKSLMDNDLIDEDEYLSKLQILLGEENKIKIPEEIVKEIKSTKNYADVILVNQKGEVLLLQRNKVSKMFPDMWGLPGGHIDEGESPIEAARREFKEETNIELEALNHVLSAKASDGGSIDYFIGTTKEGPKTIVLENKEHTNLGWYNDSDRNELEMIPDLNDKINKILEENKDLINIDIYQFYDKEDVLDIFEINKVETPNFINERIEQNKLFLQSTPYKLMKSYYEKGKVSEDVYLDFLAKGGKGSGRISGDIEKDTEHIKEITSSVADSESKNNDLEVNKYLKKEAKKNKKAEKEANKQIKSTKDKEKENIKLRDQAASFNLNKRNN